MYDTADAKKYKKAADLKRKQLARMLSQPLFPKGFSGKYPLQVEGSTLAIKTDINTVQEERAIDVMKTALEKGARVRAKPIYRKPRQKKENPMKKTIEKKKQKKQKRSKLY